MFDPTLTIREILGPEGLLARSLQEFEFRHSQMDMALLIQQAIQRKIPSIVEAGTGTGKTFGYLVPLILSGKKTVISTGTKNLQEQIYLNDLPLLSKTTGLNIDAVIMKGRGNYLCLHRYHQYFSQLPLLKNGQEKRREGLEKWLKKTMFADRSELPWLKDDDTLWDAISAASGHCLGVDCKFPDNCFLAKLRNRAAKAQIIIVNHHLFFADMKVKSGGFGEIIPRFQVLVFDEAHAIEEIATLYLGESLSTSQLLDLTNDLERGCRDCNESERKKVKAHLVSIRAASDQLRTIFGERAVKGRLGDKDLSLIAEGSGRVIRQGLRAIQTDAGLAESGNNTLEVLAKRAGELDLLFEQIVSKKGSGWLSWFERRKNSMVLYASPLDISSHLKELLYDRTKTVILTSATLSTNNNFDYIRERLGLPEHTLNGIYPSHFAFEKQTLMYIPDDLPAPGVPEFGEELANRICEILKRTAGRALVLFTSYHNLNLVYNTIKDSVPFSVYRQGDAPRSLLLEAFKRNTHSVLLATGSFWQGVDVPGEALSCLIIDKLPFDSPGEPLVSARIDSIRARGGNAFMEYQVPSAIIALKQGLGRLIRKGSDSGILSILDTRIMTSRYGRFFLESLPGIPISRNLSDIGHFFGPAKEAQNASKAVESDLQQTG
jgi:ATP-dependent DNA helicase DinG